MRPNARAGTWRYLTGLTVLVVMSLVPGCTAVFEATASKAYEGPTLPREDIAVITTKFVEDFYILWAVDTKILSIDGKKVDRKSAEVLPGPHDLVLGRGSAGGDFYPITDASSVHFNARAGGLYVALSDWYRSKTWYWIEDEATGELVAGTKPPTSN